MTAIEPVRFSRHWGMPSADTFDCEPIKGFVQRYLLKSKVSIDPFARNRRWFTYTNDLNPDTLADYHMEANDFLETLSKASVRGDLGIMDPPYSLTQVSRSYQEIGLKFKGSENPTGGFPNVKDLMSDLIIDNGFCLSFGWNSSGLGVNRGFDIVECLIVCHGGNHNDTICIAERKRPKTQLEFL